METAHRRVLAGKDKQGHVTRISLPRRLCVDSALEVHRCIIFEYYSMPAEGDVDNSTRANSRCRVSFFVLDQYHSGGCVGKSSTNFSQDPKW